MPLTSGLSHSFELPVSSAPTQEGNDVGFQLNAVVAEVGLVCCEIPTFQSRAHTAWT